MEKQQLRERRIRTDLDTGVDFEEVYRRNGKRHRDGKEGPAFILRDRVTGAAEIEEYYWYDRLHRENGPAVILRRAASGTNEVVVEEEYRRHGRYHRNSADGPAVIRRNATTGIVLEESYFENDELHRDPAEGPATITRNASTGRVVGETYWVRGQRRRDLADGPAIIVRDPVTGAVTQERYFVDGREVSPPQRPERTRQPGGPGSDLSR